MNWNCWYPNCQTQASNQIAGTACCVQHVSNTFALAAAIAKGDVAMAMSMWHQE